MVFNTVAEIPGSDKKDELVMCGGHLDSWHGGTGATDNAAGVGVCMEAVRILKALGVKPRRTIRIALWSGEEQGIFGSAAYVEKHFGTAANPKPEYEKLSAYFNLDNGTGKVRGIWGQGNQAVMPIFAQWLQPFSDLGATTVTARNTGSTDHIPFDRIGLPGFQFIQDSIEYGTRTHHSNQDVFDRIQGDDLKQASVVMAAFLYNAAMREEKLPRKSAPAPTTASVP
jgi:Zn-dependent M28 family amino/carboxypeptidase